MAPWLMFCLCGSNSVADLEPLVISLSGAVLAPLLRLARLAKIPQLVLALVHKQPSVFHQSQLLQEPLSLPYLWAYSTAASDYYMNHLKFTHVH